MKHWCHKTHQEHISFRGQGEVSCRRHLFLYDKEFVLVKQDHMRMVDLRVEVIIPFTNEKGR